MPKRKRTYPKRRPARRYRRRVGLRFRRRGGGARPMRALSTSYRGTPNSYRFVREKVLSHINLHTLSIPPFRPGTNSRYALGDLGTMSFDQLSGYAEFQPLFMNYKIDRVEIILSPAWGTTTESGPDYELDMIFLNGKYAPYMGVTTMTDTDIDTQLAQTQKKTIKRYSSKRPVKLVTNKPFIRSEVQGAGGITTTVNRSPPWLHLNTQSGVPHHMNQLFLARKRDGSTFTSSDNYSYSIRVRVHFRVSLVQ